MKGALTMKIPSTEVQNNFGKYIKIAAELEDVIITRKGREIARLVPCKERLVVNEEAVNYVFGNKKSMSYEEFIEMTEKSDQRYELIDGDVYLLASPNYLHQAVISEISVILYNWFKGKACRPLTSPFDVTLERSANNICVVQPDILVICDKEKINKKGRYTGVPALVVEVLSDSTRSKDMIKKLDLFMETGVKEYWLVDTDKREILIYYFEKQKGEFTIKNMELYKNSETLESNAFKGLQVNIGEVFSTL